MESTALFVAPLVAALFATAAAMLSVRAEDRISRWLLGLSLAVAVWSYGYLGELVAMSPNALLVWVRFEYLGIISVPLAWLGLAWTFAGRQKPPRRYTALLLAVPAVTLACVWFFPRAIWDVVDFVDVRTHLRFAPVYGAWFWIHTAFSYGATLAGSLLFVATSRRSPRAYRRHTALVLASGLLPWFANVLHIGRLTIIDWTPGTFAVSALLLVWGLGRMQLLRSTPVDPRAVLTHLGDGTLVVDGEGTVVEANAAMRAILGVAPEEAIGRRLVVVARDVHEALGAHREIGAPGLTTRVTLPTAEGKRHFEVASVPIEIGPGDRAVRLIAFRDVTEQLDTEQRLRASEGQLRTLVDGVRAVVWRADAATFRFLEVSAGAEGLLGYPAERWLEDPDFWLEHVYEEDRERASAFCRTETAAGRDHNFEYRMRRSDGNLVWIHDSARVVFERGVPTQLAGVLIDVTPERRAALELAEQGERLRGLVENSPIPMAIVRPWEGGRIESINAASQELFGYSSEELPDVAAWWRLAFPEPGERALAAGEWNEIFGSVAEGELLPTVSVERRVTCRDGTTRDIQMDAGVFGDRVLIVIHDLTTRTRVQRELAAARSYLQTVVDTSPSVILVIDREGNWRFANRYGAELYGTSPLDLEDTMARLVRPAPTEIDGLVEQCQRVIRGGQRLESERPVRGRDGTTRWFHTIVVPITPPNEERAALVIATDVTETRAAERKVAESEAALQRALDAFHGILFVKRRSREFVVLRGGVRELTGWSEEDLLSGNVRWRQVVHPDDWELVEIESRNLETLPDYVSTATYRIIRPDGSMRWIQEVIHATAPGADGAPRWQGLVLDVTERKQMDMVQARWEAQRSRFIANVIEAQELERGHIARELHDGIGQALAGLQVRISALAHRPAADVSEELSTLRGICIEAADDLRRLAKGLGPMVLDDLGLGAALVRLVDEQAQHHGLEIDLHLAPDFDWDDVEHADGIATYRIVQEALTNVAKHARARHASVVIDDRQRSLRILVEDDGCGFDVEAWRADRRAAGLGLHGIEERAALLGGTMRVESRPGGGTLLIVDLPYNS